MTVTLLGAVVLAVVLGLLRVFVKPIIVLLTLPLTIFTLGLFLLVVNALLVMLAAYIVPGFMVAGFWSAFLFAIIVSLINLLFGRAGKSSKKAQECYSRGQQSGLSQQADLPARTQRG